MVSRLLFLILSLSILACSEENMEGPPNIIIILSDDMGYSDIGCYGGEIRTPNLDQLAGNGLRFTQFYNTARCCPTRASLLTGLYPQQAGIGHMLYDRGTPAYQGDLSKQAVTIAEVLKNNGYATYMSGKWHVTPYQKDNPDKSNWPRQRGFDRFFGIIAGAASFFDPRSLVADNEYIPPREGFYCTTDFTNYAIECIQDHNTDNKPFFLYLAYTAAHWPMHAPANEVSKYKEHYNKGWDVLRLERFNRLKELGLVNKNEVLSLRDSLVPHWTDSIPDKDWELANMEVYAAMVDVMDQGIGQIVEQLKEKGIYENTLILYLQDNGACEEELEWINDFEPVSNPTPMAPDAIQTAMIPPVTRDGKAVQLMKEGWPGPADGYTAYGLNWAHLSNTPFREYKHWVHEGGISTPLILHWPAKVKSGGALRHSPTHLIDIMATCIEVSGSEYPTTYQGQAIIPLEGQSLMPVVESDSIERQALFWEHEGNRAVRMGQWKLVSKAIHEKPMVWDSIPVLEADKWELYDIGADRMELNNLAAQYPDLVEKMADLWEQWALRTGTLPRPN